MPVYRTSTDVAPTTTMPAEDMGGYIRERLEDDVLDASVAHGQLTLTVKPAAFPRAARLCKQDPALDMDFFDFLSAVDEREDGFAVIAVLYSVAHRHRVVLRAIADGGREAPEMPTLTNVYRGANWHERETYDMFGITFEGHPGVLPRILTIEGFEGWPLRKEFLLSTREAKPWPGNKEPKEAEPADDGGDGEAAAGPTAEEKAAAAKAKAERAKAKAAEMRAKKAKERAAAQSEEPQAAGQSEEPQAAGQSEEPQATDTKAKAAAESDFGEAEGAAAAQATVAAGDSEAQTPQGAAEIAGSAAAKDAAAGAASGDTLKGAPGDEPNIDQPVDDPDEENRVGEGAPPVPSGAPGVEAEGRHGGTADQGGDIPAADTAGLTSDTQEDEAARPADQTPAPGPESDRPEADEGPRQADGPEVETRPLAEDEDTEGDKS